MERRKIIKKNESKLDPKLSLTLYFFGKPLLYKAFHNIAKEKGISVRNLIISFAALGLKTYLNTKLK